MPAGRPSKYTDQFPSKLIEAMRNGLSVVRFCAQEFITAPTFYKMVDEHPEFSNAFEQGKILCEAYWEKWLVEHFDAEKVNSALVKLFMANRFGWHDKKESNHNVTIKQEDALKELG